MGSSILNYQTSRVANSNPVVLKHSSTASSSAGAAGTTTLATYTLPGGLMGPNDGLRITVLYSCTNNANAKNAVISWGSGANDVMYNNCASAEGYQTVAHIFNNNATNAQKCRYRFYTTGFPYGEYNGAANESFAVDTTADVAITFTAEGMTATDNLILESYTIELIRAV